MSKWYGTPSLDDEHRKEEGRVRTGDTVVASIVTELHDLDDIQSRNETDNARLAAEKEGDAQPDRWQQSKQSNWFPKPVGTIRPLEKEHQGIY